MGEEVEQGGREVVVVVDDVGVDHCEDTIRHLWHICRRNPGYVYVISRNISSRKTTLTLQYHMKWVRPMLGGLKLQEQ